MSIGGAITLAASKGLDHDDVEDLEFSLKTCHENIFAYKQHMMRAFCQNYFWDLAGEEKNEEIAFLIQVYYYKIDFELCGKNDYDHRSL